MYICVGLIKDVRTADRQVKELKARAVDMVCILLF